MSSDTVLVLMPGADVRVLGLSSRVRNRRVAERAGVDVVDVAVSEYDKRRPAFLVPPDVLIEASLFPLAPLGTSTILKPDGLNVLDVRTASARRKAAWAILGRTAKATDGWIARRFNRPISRLVSFGLLSLGLSALHATLLTLVVGLAGAAVAAVPAYWWFVAAGILFQFVSVLDGVDGEMARATLTESALGARLDTIVDRGTYFAYLAGVTIGWAREGGTPQAMMWVAAVAAALVLSLLRGAHFVSEPNASFVFIDRSVRRAAEDSGNAVLHAAAGLFTLLRRDAFAIVFLFVSLTGQRMLVPAFVAFGVMLANFTFSVYDRELAAAAERLGSR